MKHEPNEAIFWTMFSAGGVVSAFMVPVFLFVFFLAPGLRIAHAPSYENLIWLSSLPLVRLFLFIVCAMSLFHWAHRFRFTLYDGLQVKHLNELIFTFCYGGAALGTVIAAYLLWRIPTI
jgi:succinate dehydrogenase subunit D